MKRFVIFVSLFVCACSSTTTSVRNEQELDVRACYQFSRARAPYKQCVDAVKVCGEYAGYDVERYTSCMKQANFPR